MSYIKSANEVAADWGRDNLLTGIDFHPRPDPSLRLKPRTGTVTIFDAREPVAEYRSVLVNILPSGGLVIEEIDGVKHFYSPNGFVCATFEPDEGE